MPEPIGRCVADEALKWVGTPFRWEASLKGKGADCKGLLAGVARGCGRKEGEAVEAGAVGYSRRIPTAELEGGLDRLFDRLPDTAGLQCGDVLGFRIQGKLRHLGIYTGGGRMVHAHLGDPAQVVEVPLGGFWMKRLAAAWRWRDHG